MTILTLPLTMYSIADTVGRTNQPNGSPATVLIEASRAYALIKSTLATIPLNAVVATAKVRVVAAGPTPANNTTATVIASEVTGLWTSSVTWDRQPTVAPGQVGIDTESVTAGTVLELDVTSWLNKRSPFGLRLSSTQGLYLFGSTAPENRPYLVVDYAVPPDVPTNLQPSFGLVGVPKPSLSCQSSGDITSQRVEIRLNGGAIWDSGWVSTTTGFFEQPAGAPTPGENGVIEWRVTIRNSQGTSPVSDWATYQYTSSPILTITEPGDTTSFGAPTLRWTFTGQARWKAALYSGTYLVDSTPGWLSESATRSWTPSRGVQVPGGVGRYELEVSDGQNRVASANSPAGSRAVKTFTTELSGNGAAASSISLDATEPVPTITGIRAAGVPSEIALFRDGLQVPIWNRAGEPVLRGKGSDFFSGLYFTIRDYTADPRKTHTWYVVTYVGGVGSSNNPTVQARVDCDSVWLVNPRTDERVEILGYDGYPAVEQDVVENSIVHVPVSQGGTVETVRRKMNRTTRSGGLEGTVLGEDEDTLDKWAQDSANTRYRLIFGKVNWTVIIGDYVPTDVSYGDPTGPDRVLVSLNWWERLGN